MYGNEKKKTNKQRNKHVLIPMQDVITKEIRSTILSEKKMVMTINFNITKILREVAPVRVTRLFNDFHYDWIQ